MKKIIMIIIFISCSILCSEYYALDEWHIVQKIDPITDDKEISIFIKKQEERSLNFNTFIIKINSNSININLYTPSIIFKKDFNESNNNIDIIYRLDKNEPRNTVLNKYGESEFYSLTNSQNSSQKSIVFLKEMLSYNTLAVRAIENINNIKHTYTYVYDLNQLSEILFNADFNDTILENYKSEFDSIINQKNKSEEKSSYKTETNEEETNKINHKENIYMIDDINYII
ncbi:hypothetical protein [uncultured Brachyspira sp.]|uniref:hypothetical protein n=1 Tax=uncultured Brachyspira sp. TaxID=221953 RepID=UPI0025D0AB5A|nr:hypothetical protein [uncultured Brachyspira sp.]